MTISKETDQSMVIAVMGTGRSGTSLITKILNILEVYLGPEGQFMAPTTQNPKGYYELMPIFDLNNAVLDSMGGNIWEPPEFKPGWEASPELAPHRKKLQALIRELFGDAPCWAFKDPRSCWLMPFWRPFLPKVRSIFALRNPLDTARSLWRAYGLNLEQALAYWHKSLSAALENTADQKRLFVFYEDLLEDPEGELLRMARFIGREEEARRPETMAKVRSFVERKLHRNRTPLAEFLCHPDISFRAKALHLALRAFVNGGGCEVASCNTVSFQRLLDDFSSQSLERGAGEKAGEASPAMASPRKETLPGVSLVIPVFNGAAHLPGCLEALEAHTPPDSLREVIAVNMGSLDGTGAVLDEACARYPWLEVIHLREHCGYGAAANLGARRAMGAYLLFLDADTEVRPGWLAPLVDVLDRDPLVAVAGSKMILPDGVLQHAGFMIFDDRRVPDPLIPRPIYRGSPGDLPDANEGRTYQALSAACLLVRKKAFQGAGGFDEEYWSGYEDVDLCLKLQEQGGLIVYEPGSVIVHHEDQSGPERMEASERNLEHFHARWLGKIKPDMIIERDERLLSGHAGRVGLYEEPRRLEATVITP